MNCMKMSLKIILMLLFYTICGNVLAQSLAFPTAEGYGKYTVGGRGGTVYEVTNLNDSGTGSLRAAIEASGPRMVIFKVSGTIVLSKNLNITNPNITIAGQTAPGDRICLRKHTLNIDADEVIIRYIRIRYGDEVQTDADALSMRFHKNIIIDHVSASWGDDETLSLYHGENVTVQWCMINETLNRGGSHGFAGIWGSPYSTFHHNFVSNCVSRNMRFASGSGNTDYRNNVIYNWGYNSAYGGENQQVGDANYSFTNVNMVNNYYKPGPGTATGVKHRIINPSYRDVKTDYGKFYVSGNYMVGFPTVTADNWNGGVDPAGGSGDLALVKLDTPWPAMAINEQTAVDAYQSVLAGVGCAFPKRDAVDTRLISEAITGTTTYGTLGVIESQTQVGGWPVLNSTTPPVDTDHDGIPDSWEIEKGLNPNQALDGFTYTLTGTYTNLEVYINSLVDNVAPVPVTGITLSPDTGTVGVGGTLQLTANLAPSNATNKTVTWSSDNTAVAKVNALGAVTGISAGTATITATTLDGNFKATSTLTASFIPVTGVTLAPAEAQLSIGTATTLTASILPETASNKSINWTSSNALVATVSASGVVTGVASGTAVITATTVDGQKTATCNVSVVEKPLLSPLVKLGFNENTGSIVNNTGSAAATFTMSSPPAWATNVPKGGGESSVNFGTTNGNYAIESNAVVSALAGLANFTIAGWVNCCSSVVGSGGNRIVTWINNGGNGVDVVYLSDGSLKVGINQWPDKSTAISSAGKITTNASATDTNWKFFAVTYRSLDGTFQFIFGDNTTAAALDKTFTYSQGAVGASIGNLCVGHFNTQSQRATRSDRMFKGLIDQIEIYGSVLSLQDIQYLQYHSSDPVGISKMATTASFSVYPNPVRDVLWIELNGQPQQAVACEVVDMTGRIVLHSSLECSTSALNVNHLESGSYLVKLTCGGNSLVKHVVKW